MRRFDSHQPRAVITGIGVVSSLGIGAAAFWDALRSGRHGFQRVPLAESAGMPSQCGAPIEGFQAKEYLEKKDRKRLSVMPIPFQFAVAASRLAMQDAGLTPDLIASTRLATVLGAGTVPCEPHEFARGGQVSTIAMGHVDLHKWGQEGMSLVPPMWMLSYIPNMVGCHVSVLNDAQGPSNTITQTDLAGVLAIGEAWRYLRRGAADVVLVGGADTRSTAMSLDRQELMQPLSRRNADPEHACRPFDRDRDGIVCGDGGGILVLETEEHARQRGARIYAEIVGFGAAYDTSADRGFGHWKRGVPSERGAPYPVRAGHKHGLARAARIAMQQAGITPADLDHVNAHGLSTVADDIWEAQGLAQALAPQAPPVFAPKSRFGALGAGTGAVEMAASILAMHHGELPATRNCDHPDPACPIRVSTASRPVTKSHFLKVSFTELGQCAAIVCRRYLAAGD